MQGIDEVPATELRVIETEEVAWNECSIKQKILDVGQPAVTGLGVAVNIVKASVEGGEPIESAIGVALQVGLETARCEVKAVVAGAVKSVAVEELIVFLPAL